MEDLVADASLQDLNFECLTLKEIMDITYDLTKTCCVDCLKNRVESNEMLPPGNFEEQLNKNGVVSSNNGKKVADFSDEPAFSEEDALSCNSKDDLVEVTEGQTGKEVADFSDEPAFSEEDALSYNLKDDLVEVTEGQRLEENSFDEIEKSIVAQRHGFKLQDDNLQNGGASCLQSSTDEGVQIALLLEDEYESACGTVSHNTITSSIGDISNCGSSSVDKPGQIVSSDTKSPQPLNYHPIHCYQSPIPNQQLCCDCRNHSNWSNCDPSPGLPKVRSQSKSHGTARHANSKRYTCPYCDYGTVYPRNLKLHIMAKHTNDKPPLSCPQCDATTSGEHVKFHTIATKHLKDNKHPPPVAALACPHCENCSVTTGTLKLHIKHRHLTDIPSLSCQCCNFKNGQTNGIIKQHIIGKHKERHAFCPYCEFRAVETELLKRHSKCKHN